MKALFLTILLACSCTQQATLSRDAMGLRVSEVEMDIHHLDEIEWVVGKKKEATVSQSFTFLVDMPKLSEEDLAFLTEQKGINAWILRLIVQRGSERQDLGSLYAPFKAKRVVRGQSAGAPTSVALKVFYAAAYASERFRVFDCPAFDHNKKIVEMDIRGELKPFELSVGQTSSYREKSQLVELTPSSFNGGNSLIGEYFVEIAPYNSDKKLIYASFKRIPMYVEVRKEENIPVSSCLGENPEIKL